MNSQAPWLVFKGSRVCLVSCVAAELGCSVLGTVENVQLCERETAVNDQSVSYSSTSRQVRSLPSNMQYGGTPGAAHGGKLRAHGGAHAY